MGLFLFYESGFFCSFADRNLLPQYPLWFTNIAPMPIPAYIEWTVNPEIFALGPIHLRWYGLLFATGFGLGYFITRKVFLEEKNPEAWLDPLLLLMALGTMLGARFGHVFFYNWEYYSAHPDEILKIWQGGLASHGAFVGLMLAFWAFSKFWSKKSILWITDRIAMSVALGGVFIRLGNLFNHEIVGAPTEVPWAFIFTLYPDRVPIPRHPAQLYESFSYLIIAGILAWLFWRTKAKERQGLLTSLFLILVFGARFLIEYVKEVQEAFELDMSLKMGQQLSIPLILLGLAGVAWAYRDKLGALLKQK